MPGEADLLLPLVYTLVASSLLGLASRRIGLPMVAGFVAGGMIVGPLAGLVDREALTLRFLAELGIILITFEIGLTLRLDFFARGGLRAFSILMVEVLLVSLLTFALGSLLSIGWGDLLVLLFLAVNTSSALAFKLLEERAVAAPAFRELLLALAAQEDVVALIGLTLFPLLARLEPANPVELARSLLLIPSSVALLLFVGLRYLRRPLEYFARVGGETFLAMSFALVLAFSYLGVISGLSSALGAFIAGLVVSNSAVSEKVADALRSLRHISALFFFSSIGASMPVSGNPLLFAAGVGIALLSVALKYFGFSIASWLLGTELSEAFRLGLYMTSISEFGIIVARGGLEAGLATQTFYTASVLAFTLSSLLSATLVKFEHTLPGRLAHLFPLGLRLGLERASMALRNAFSRRVQGSGQLRAVASEFLKRLGIILVVTLIGNVLVELSGLLPPWLYAPAVAFIVLSVGVVVVLVALRMRATVERLGLEMEPPGDSPRAYRARQLGAMLYTLVLLGIGLWILGVSYPRLGRLMQAAQEQGLAPLLFVLILALLLALAFTRLRAIASNLERAFGIGHPTGRRLYPTGSTAGA